MYVLVFVFVFVIFLIFQLVLFLFQLWKSPISKCQLVPAACVCINTCMCIFIWFRICVWILVLEVLKSTFKAPVSSCSGQLSRGQGHRFQSNYLNTLLCGKTNWYFHFASIAILVVWTIPLIYFCWSRDVRTMYNQIINSLQERSKPRRVNCEIFFAQEKITLMWISALCCSIERQGQPWVQLDYLGVYPWCLYTISNQC